MKEIECPKTLILIYLCGLNKTLIHWELSLQKVELFVLNVNYRKLNEN